VKNVETRLTHCIQFTQRNRSKEVEIIHVRS
jgi:hypothetical protein